MDDRPGPAQRSRPRTVPEGIADARVLVVDDVPENREILVRRLARLGIRNVVEAADGREALEQLDRARFDLVLLDIMMPVMNGYEVLECLNADGRITSLPVIVISALNEVDAIATCIEQGAEDFLFKPFNPTLLRARVVSSLEKKALHDRTRQELQRKQAELAEARMLQLALVPPGDTRAAAFGAITIDLVLDPAKEVGGDLVDHFPIGEHLHALIIGDVSDKGAGAALMMARTCALFRGLAARPDAELLFADPAGAIGEANRTLAASNAASMFVTLWLGTLDLRDGRLRHVRAGHVPPYLRRATGATERLDTLGGIPLGVIEDAPYAASEALLRPGDSLLVITDGVSEATTHDGAMFGEAAAATWLDQTADGGLDDLVRAVRIHEAGMPPSDDLAALLLRISGPAFVTTITPFPDQISDLIDRASAFLRSEDVDARTTQHAGLVIDELLANVARHGLPDLQPCDIEIEVEPDRVRLRISDRSSPFDPRNAPEPDIAADLDSRPIGGLGLYIVRQLAHDIGYCREENRNITSLCLARDGNGAA